MRNIIILTCAISISGCATIVQSGPDRVQVRSTPDGATVLLDGIPAGKTPMVLPINRKDEGVIELRADGYESVVIDRDKVVAGWVFGNLLIGGPIGVAVDLITHNQGKYSEDPIMVELKPSRALSSHR